ncbi:MAG: hypothetical protein AAGA75_14815 [Cyanobacteria bacterium P01_E01_bin.6]
MDTFKFRIHNLGVTLWHYLNQPLFDPTKPLVFNPFQFVAGEQSHSNRVQFLERCLKLDCTSEQHHEGEYR